MQNSDGCYRSLCSSETLRSGSKGFFHDFTEQVIGCCGEAWIEKIFGRLQTDEDRLRIIFTDEKCREPVLATLARTQLLFRDKDAAISRRKRLQGFELATAGQTEKALWLLSQAVVRAPKTGKCRDIDQGFSLPLALLGRAEILIGLGEYSCALDDLRLAAAEQQLPNNLKTELARKREQCERLLRENERSLVPASGGRPIGPTKPSRPRVSGGGSSDLGAGVSDSVIIQETAMAGKQAVASRKIQPGDVLVVEPPLAGCLLPEHFGTHCQHCFQRFKAPLGCPDCSSVTFCDRACREQAIASHHKYECKILALLIGSGMSVLSFLALRMVTQNGLEKTLRIYDILGKGGSRANFEEEQRPVSGVVPAKPSKSAKRRMRKKKLKDSSRSTDGMDELFKDKETDQLDTRAYQLVTHEKIRPARDFFERTLMAAFLVKCLQRVGFFEQPSKDDECPTEEEMAVGSVLLKNLQLVQFNAHEFFETRRGLGHRFRGSKPVYLGVAVYPTVSRFNHDCYPAVTRYFVGREIVIRATRCLEEGDVIAENYGPIFTKRTLRDRQRTLAGRYWFRCTCKACQQDWPSFQGMTNDSARLRCPTEGCASLHPRVTQPENSTKCPGCRKKIQLAGRLAELRHSEQLYQRGFERMDQERTGEAIEVLIEGMKMFHRVAAPPHRDTHLAEIALSSCLADSGNCWSPPPCNANEPLSDQ